MPASAGGAATKLFAGTHATWCPDSTNILFQGGGTLTAYLHSAKSISGSPLVVSNALAGKSCGLPTMSPDKRWLAYVYYASPSQSQIVVADASSLPNSNSSTVEANTYSVPSGFKDSMPTFSPDSKTMLFGRTPSSVYTIYATDPSNQSPQVLGAVGVGQYTPVWSPFLSNRTFVGSSAVGTQTAPMFANAAGFMLAQNGSRFASFAAFTATTPSTATVTSLPQAGGGAAIIERIHADAITGLKFSNSYYPAPTSIPTGNVPDALISFDGTLGTVQSVAPFAIRGSNTGLAKTSSRYGELTYSGSFSAVFDSNGVNRAPQGAREITLDQRTGKLLSVR
jgi:hypothetical protein